MRQFLWVITLISAASAAYGQQTEFSVQAGSGLFGFRGPGAVSETVFIISDVSSVPDDLGNPYGRSTGFPYSLAGQIQRVTTNRLIYGTQAGFESLTNRATITQVILEGPPVKSDGRAAVRNQYVNLHPFVGKRFGNERISLDATAGVDLGLSLSERQTIQLTGSNYSFQLMDSNRPHPAVDIRPRLNLTGYYRAFGLSLGYSHGLTGYATSSYSSVPRAYSRMWRIGVVYRLVKRA